MMPVHQRCPICHEWFWGSDAIGSPCMSCESKQAMDEIERLRAELHAAGDGDTWRDACKRLEEEVERLRENERRIIGTAIEGSESKSFSSVAEMLTDMARKEADESQEGVERLRAERDEAREAAKACFHEVVIRVPLNRSLTVGGLIQKWSWLEE